MLIKSFNHVYILLSFINASTLNDYFPSIQSSPFKEISKVSLTGIHTNI